MRYLQNRFIRKFTAVFLLLTTLSSVVQPTLTFALTTGPHQPEYTSYEEPGATDMVNLLTGDFSLSLPILEVPGPEGGFSVPLTYNAGIGLDQEASWVGLGWTLNVGAITRSVVQYPDDASGEMQSIRRVDYDGVRGWSSNLLGLGQIGWNTAQGHYGTVSLFGLLNVHYDKNGTTVGVAGLNIGSNGVSFDGAQFVMAAFSVASFGAGAAGAEGMSLGLQAGISAAESAVLALALGNTTPNSPTDGYWEYSKKTTDHLFYEDYWIWLDQTRFERMLGVLNFEKAQLNEYQQPFPDLELEYSRNGEDNQTIYEFTKTGYSQGIASDISCLIPSGTSFENVTSPVVLATDNYSVKAPGISGSIKPYRLDVSSVSMPRQMSPSHARLALLPAEPHKVPFIYEGSNANSYFYHVGGLSSVNSPVFYGGVSTDVGNADVSLNNTLEYLLDDVIFQERIRPDLEEIPKVAMANHTEWLTNQDIINTTGSFSSGFMDYFTGSDRIEFRERFTFGPNKSVFNSSDDISDGRINIGPDELIYFTPDQTIDVNVTAYFSGYDWETGTGDVAVQQFATTVISKHDGGTGQSYIMIDASDIPSIIKEKYCEIIVTTNDAKRQNSIGGYSITGINGMTYHFSLPIYEYQNYTQIKDVAHPTTQFTEIVRDEPFASTWVLTGITGSDFVDRGGEDNLPNGMIDENDWGYWVKFSYGKYTENYKWAIPFSGSTPDENNASTSSSTGHKQIVYLNSIETRSHVALFLKKTRSDNRGKNVGESPTNAGLTLRLSEIELLTREDFKRLFEETGSGGYGLTSDVGYANLTTVFMESDFLAHSGSNPGAFIKSNAIKRIRFNQDYSLCQGTDNSVASGNGKLTLVSLSTLGKNGAKLLPDYKFEYENNPSYNANKWDGWGMYARYGSAAHYSHTASSYDDDGAAWSLTKITNPLGSTIEVEYERDTYSSISGGYMTTVNNSFTYTGSNYLPWGGAIDVPDGSIFSVGETVHISGDFDYSCDADYQYGTPAGNSAHYEGDYEVLDVSGNRVTLENFRGESQCTGEISLITHDLGVIKKKDKAKPGGNIRVSSLILKDQGNEFKTRYIYNTPEGFSTGVVAKEPDYIKNSFTDFDFYNLPGYPFTPVMYGKVTVLSGALTTDSDFHTKQVYEFETPNSNMLSNSDTSEPYTTIGTPFLFGFSKVRVIQNKISDYTSRIGKLKSQKLYDKYDVLVSSSVMSYSSEIPTRNYSDGTIENRYQGIYSEGSMMIDRMQVNNIDYNKISRTTILKYPYQLTKVTNAKDGFVSETENMALDFISGQVVQKIEKSPLGLRSMSITVPAYAFYPEMGSKAESVSNKNMLAQEAANYSYRIDNEGEIIGLLSATVQTWKSDWNNYRSLDEGTYVDDEGDNAVWRKHKNYVYKGNFAALRTDGTATLSFSSSNEFDFDPEATNTGWQQVGEITRYDHFSAAIESKDLNNIYSSAKKDILQKRTIASASNAGYHEFVYSGAEDWNDSDGAYLGGEIAKGDGSPVYYSSGTETHTGKVAVQVASGDKTFIYKPETLKENRVYRASVWTNSLDGVIYYKINGGSQVTVSPISTMKVGSWYQINAEIPISSFSSLETGVLSTSGSVSFDDFRFQPLDGSLTANVYDPVTGAVTHSLDNMNMFTRYEYNDAGQLIKTYSESFRFGVKLVSEDKINYRRFYTNK